MHLKATIQFALHNGTSLDRLRERWLEAEELGADAIYVSDHFVVPGSDGSTFEALSVLAALAQTTVRADVGSLVLGNSFRNPNLVADMARTIDHISGGRMILGLGAGYIRDDYELYGYEYGTAGSRLRDLERGLQLIKARLPQLKPPPLRDIPVLVGGGGEKVALRLVAQYADVWNVFAPLPFHRDEVAHKIAVLDRWCAEVGRDSAEIARAIFVAVSHEAALRDPQTYLDLGCTEFIVGTAGPDWPLDRLKELLAWRDAQER